MHYFQRDMDKRLELVINNLHNRIYTKHAQAGIEAYITKEPVAFQKRTTGTYKKLYAGDAWGELFDCAWFHFTGIIPEAAHGMPVYLLLDVSGEMCVFNAEGEPVRGLTSVASDFNKSRGTPAKRTFEVTPRAEGGECIDVWADAGCNDLFGNYIGQGKIVQADICTRNDAIRDLYYDFFILKDLASCLPENSARQKSVYFALYEAANLLRDYSKDEISQAARILHKELAKKGGDPSLTVTAIGHAHIDLAWLWPVRETIRKTTRTFATALDLMERYPGYYFGASQPQQYQWIKERYPSLYTRIARQVKQGRWECQGGMWVECDTNLTGGEALVRQCLYGKQFFREEFGQDVRVCWLPDVFGYSGALPQILKLAGMDFFMTQKLSWNNINPFPHHTFRWQGIDGTQVLAHMLPEETYNSPATPTYLKLLESNYREKGVCSEALSLFGIGDGGGGPSPSHLEHAKRVENLEGLVPYHQGLAIDFFKRISENQERYPLWKGELYFERHQGTYTSQSVTKQMNALCQNALHTVEWLSVLALVVKKQPYPKEELENIWKEVMLYQFHDILPGSSIGRVYAESSQRYQSLLDQLQTLNNQVIHALQRTDNNEITLYNSLSWPVTHWIKDEKGTVHKAVLPPLGYLCGKKEWEIEKDFGSAGDGRLENNKFRLLFDEKGAIISIWGKETGREFVLQDAKANQFVLFQDHGDAWDIPMGYRDIDPVHIECIRQEYFTDELGNPVACIDYAFGKSNLNQTITLRRDGRIDFDTWVNWHEQDQMLRVQFPLSVVANRVACETQFGFVDRSTLQNTSLDYGMMEISAQKWVDLSETDYGMGVMSIGKHGYYIKDHLIEMALLRGTRYPDPEADQGKHHFIYALYPHESSTTQCHVIQKAYELHFPPIQQYAGILPELPLQFSLLQLDQEAVIIETIKEAEHENAIVARLYESLGSSVTAKIKIGFDYQEIYEANLLEEKIDELMEPTLSFRPFEIKTVIIVLKKDA